MDRDVHTTTLGSLLGGWTVNVVGAEISKRSDVRCAAVPGRGGASSWPVAKASEEDHARWHGAADRLLATIRALQAKESAASLHLRPPFAAGSLGTCATPGGTSCCAGTTTGWPPSCGRSSRRR